MFTGTEVHYEQAAREQVARPVRRMRRMCVGTPVWMLTSSQNRGRVCAPGATEQWRAYSALRV